ncbi:MAG: hypothetical protein E7K90_20080 [Hafnia alvei]|uniref:hypothetical protein n=1 Tax=Hafnia alvei TaxID=569 RepID=UPI00290BB8C7|nr:hypothetical protein [Hafnia alvei]MDU7483669.1 hypothetical protein [Hafnia alvei]
MAEAEYPTARAARPDELAVAALPIAIEPGPEELASPLDACMEITLVDPSLNVASAKAFPQPQSESKITSLTNKLNLFFFTEKSETTPARREFVSLFDIDIATIPLI